MTKVVRMFGERGENGRSARVRNTAEAAGRATTGMSGQGSREARGEGCSAEDKAGALARMVLDHRGAFGLSQREFAEESGVSRPVLSKLEQGELYPGGKVRRKLAEAMGVSPVALWRISPDAGDGRPGFTGPTKTGRIEEAS